MDKQLPNDFLRHPPASFRWRARLRKTAPVRLLYQRRWPRRGSTLLLSFPKAGRTWLRLMMGKAMALHYRLDDADLIKIDQMADQRPGIPRIKAKHDDNPHFKTPEELVVNKSEYRHVQVILLVRDLRDLTVSNYFEFARRLNQTDLKLHEYVRMRRGGVETMVRYHNIWARNLEAPAAFKLARYEDLHADPEAQLKELLTFCRVEGVSDQTVAEAVRFARFENMRKLERSGSVSSRLQAADPNDTESYKTRKGKVGGYSDYLSAQDIEWINGKIRNELDPFFGYHP
jgi:hypothetical protein